MCYAINLLRQAIKDIKSGECSDEDIAAALVTFNPETRGYIKEDEFVNYDEACKLLGIGWNRNRLNNLCKKYGVRNHTFNNAHIGFRKREIIALRAVVDKEK